ncbi:MAG: oxidoreductase [Flammeovirgaceae bacterium]|nr:MAG: oxidoreductase [Flammeovirgaceae bacterium]
MPFFVYFLSIFACQTLAQPVITVPLQVDVPSSFRALSVVNSKVAWVAGSNGYVGRTTDGGTTWQFNRAKGFEGLDFRSLYAFNRKQAIIANAGTPARILRTADGGKTWKSVYTNTHADAFIDGMDFWNKQEGITYGDPIDGRMVLLRTTDGGKSWKPVKQPLLAQGEASFAASGTGIRCFNKLAIVIATGGAVSRLWHSADKGDTWHTVEVPVIQGVNSAGIFSVGIRGNTWIVAGGNYQQPNQTERHIFYSTDAGKTWQAPVLPTRGYRECVENLQGTMWVAAGPTGAEVSVDNGITWSPLSDEQGFHTVRKARKGSLTLMAGNGKLQVVKPQGK